MSRLEYEESKQIAMLGVGFYGIIMAAMRQADSDNLGKLQTCWPHVWVELQSRHNAPGGVIESDQGRLP